VASVPLSVAGDSSVHGRQPIRFEVRATDGSANDVVDSSFFGPM
jgi:hypothetical protein